MTMKMSKITLNEERNVFLTAMLNDLEGKITKRAKKPAVLIIPGGAYRYCSDGEAEVVAYPYLQAGFHAFVLRYSVGEHRKWPNPMEDYEQAMALLSEKQDEWKIMMDKIAVIGFSAGGHLAATAATSAKTRPAAAIIGYGALDKEIVDHCGENLPYPTEQVDSLTCPCFLFAARDDNMVPIISTVNFQKALIEHSISFESHIYAYGEHGFSIGEATVTGNCLCSRVPHWVNDSIGWLYDVLGEWTSEGLGTPKCEPKLNGNAEEYLSVNCTIDYLKGLGTEVQEIMNPLYEDIEKRIEMFWNKGESGEIIKASTRYLKLQKVLQFVGKSNDEIQCIDEALSRIRNTDNC